MIFPSLWQKETYSRHTYHSILFKKALKNMYVHPRLFAIEPLRRKKDGLLISRYVRKTFLPLFVIRISTQQTLIVFINTLAERGDAIPYTTRVLLHMQWASFLSSTHVLSCSQKVILLIRYFRTYSRRAQCWETVTAATLISGYCWCLVYTNEGLNTKPKMPAVCPITIHL